MKDLEPSKVSVNQLVRERAESHRLAREMAEARLHRTGAFVIGRRAFLRGAGGLTLALPGLAALEDKTARAAAAAPKRFLLWHQGQGTQFNEWAIPGSGDGDFQFGKILEPVSAYKDRMLFFRGVDNKISSLASGDGHTTKQSTCLTCEPNGQGPSFDQVLSSKIRKPGQRSSLNLAVGRTARMRFYAAAGDRIESQGDPRKVLSSLFTEAPSGNQELQKLAARRKSVLDAVRENFTTFRSRLGKVDQVRLDQHADKLRELELRYMQQASSSCAKPTLSFPGTFNPGVDHVASADAQIEIVAMAFACNLTPVASIEFTDDHDPAVFGPFSSGFSNWHDMVHVGEQRRNIAGLISGYRWYADRFARLMKRLSEVQDDKGPLIDSTLVQWTCDFGYGIGHNGLSVHTCLAGTLGPNVKMGRLFNFLDVEKAWQSSPWALNNLYVTILNAFGIADQTFGNQGAGVKPGPIPGVL